MCCWIWIIFCCCFASMRRCQSDQHVSIRPKPKFGQCPSVWTWNHWRTQGAGGRGPLPPPEFGNLSLFFPECFPSDETIKKSLLFEVWTSFLKKIKHLKNVSHRKSRNSSKFSRKNKLRISIALKEFANLYRLTYLLSGLCGMHEKSKKTKFGRSLDFQ